MELNYNIPVYQDDTVGFVDLYNLLKEVILNSEVGNISSAYFTFNSSLYSFSIDNRPEGDSSIKTERHLSNDGFINYTSFSSDPNAIDRELTRLQSTFETLFPTEGLPEEAYGRI